MTREEQINGNLGLVHACARKFMNRGIEYDDLFSAGCVGLIKAVDNFDESRGFRLSTYAVPVILGEIRRLFRDGGTVRVSRSLKELALKAERISQKYRKEHGRDMTIDELAFELQTDRYKASQALCAMQSVLSLTGGGDDDKGIDIPVDSQEEKITEQLSLRQTISQLSENDRQLINLRYYKHMTQVQTAEVLGMSQVQVSRREKKLLTYMREKLSS